MANDERARVLLLEYIEGVTVSELVQEIANDPKTKQEDISPTVRLHKPLADIMC